MPKDLFPCVKELPTDYNAYGGEVKCWADPELDAPYCSSGCRRHTTRCVASPRRRLMRSRKSASDATSEDGNGRSKQ